MYTFAMSTFAAFSTSIREIQLEGDVANDGHFNIRLVRLLQETETNQTNVTDAVGVSDDGENGISIGYLFVIVVICSIGLCYLYCLYHTLRSWYIRRFGQGEETMLVTDSFRFLNSTQRLAVLERIFSDTSKPVSGSSMPEGNKVTKKCEGSGETKNDLEILKSTTLDNFVDLEANEVHHLEPTTPATVVMSSPAQQTPDSELSGSYSAEASKTTHKDLSPEENIRHLLPWETSGPWENGECKDLRIPTLGEEDEDVPPYPQLINNPNFAQTVSFGNHSECNSEEEDEEDLCAICLSGYKEGEMVIASKYCKHSFHKECIFEWLTKNHDCPICRVGMVTPGDINNATTSLVGKSRITKAFESIRMVASRSMPSPRLPANFSSAPDQSTEVRRTRSSNL